MTDILIQGMEMPRQGLKVVAIHSNGHVYADTSDPRFLHKIADVIELPEHGDLIDRDAFKKENAYFWHRDFINPKHPDTLEDLMLAAHVVVQAERSGE